MRKAALSSLAQSVPNFSAVIRKENRRPVNYNTTPPPPTSKSRNGGVLTGSASSAAARGSKSESAEEKKSKGVMGMARKSYASVEDLKKITMATASTINGGGAGGRKAGEGGGRGTILGYRQIY